mmetsp:Transcript_43368/g.112810  ORF Transcript_43368/g.112810 Transcript_43368/m.112810 type:complete len:225 (-) Transcript_43368:1600-2274(-)
MASTAVVLYFFQPASLPLKKLIHIDRLRCVRNSPCLAPLSQAGKHVDSFFHCSSLHVKLCCILIAALEGIDLGGEKLLIRQRLLSLLFHLIEQVNVAEVAHTKEGLSCYLQVEVAECLHSEVLPITVGHAEAGDFISPLEVLYFDIAVERCRLRHLLRLHGDEMKTENARAFESHHESLQLLHGHWKASRLDGEESIAGEAQHIFKLGVPRDRVGVRLAEHLVF